MPKLTDTQLVILSAAAQHKDAHALPVPKSLNARGAAMTKTLEALTKKGLLEERPAAPNTKAWREADDGRRMSLIITDAGRDAINGEPSEPATKASGPTKRSTKTKVQTIRKRETPAPMPRPGTKLATVISLMERKTGATIDELTEATDWQAHSVRGAISGALKKKLGLMVISEKTKDRGRVYRISKVESASGSLSKGPNS